MGTDDIDLTKHGAVSDVGCLEGSLVELRAVSELILHKQ